MEIFYTERITGNHAYLAGEEALHCVRVLRHKEGDSLDIIDGTGRLLHCSISTIGKEVEAVIKGVEEGWGAVPYRLTMGVCPTKNNERFEWFVEKAVELGIDRIIPVIGERSERRVYKSDRAKRIALSAVKQSLKGKLPVIDDAVRLQTLLSQGLGDTLGLIACCFDPPGGRRSVTEVLREGKGRDIFVLIGPEGDFSPSEVRKAMEKGFIPIHLGDARLRTETAALTAVEAVYLSSF